MHYKLPMPISPCKILCQLAAKFHPFSHWLGDHGRTAPAPTP